MNLEELALINYVKDWHDALVPKSYVAYVGHYPVLLGEWVRTQREKYRSGTLMKDTIDFLESVDGWEWDPKKSTDSEKLLVREALMQFYFREDASSIPLNHIEMIDDEPVKLGEWFHDNVPSLEPPRCGTPFIKMSSSDANDYKATIRNIATDLGEGDRKKIFDEYFKNFSADQRARRDSNPQPSDP